MADDDDASLDALPGGLRRMWSTARLTSRLGAKAAGRMLFRRTATDTEPATATETETAAAVAAATQLVAKMGQLKGLVMKAGQIASYMPGSLPPAAQQVMAQLQAQSAPMAFPRIADVLRAELGAAPGELFESIDAQPFAAASIGQVHRAVYRGRAVAVKVQYPGIEDLIRSDLKMVGVIARLSSVGSPIDGGALASELRDRLVEECDYVREAASQRTFATLLAAIPGSHVPAVVAERSSRRVLTTELSAARPLAELAAGTDQAARDRAGVIVFRSCFDLLWRRCIYNADPHPGNYLASAGGDVTFLDFGCVRRFEPSLIASWKLLARSILANDRAAFATQLDALGFIGKAKGFDFDYQLAAMRELYRPLLEPAFRFDAAFVARSFGTLMFDNPNKFRLAMPPAWLFLNRLQWGLYAVLAQLGATGPWRRIIDDALDAPLDPA
jgi:predicted unusual protein kinase regulating ubiquinone biosynthesis (AarF/ABC1/UbiB family)|nr:AarF/ABC1/UbiB kinase family protein [Kofleriaceae bacterium]